jgi:hypothetical protein
MLGSTQDILGKSRDSTAAIVSSLNDTKVQLCHLKADEKERQAKDCMEKEGPCVIIKITYLQHLCHNKNYYCSKKENPSFFLQTSVPFQHFRKAPSLLHARPTSRISQTYMLCRAHQPQ